MNVFILQLNINFNVTLKDDQVDNCYIMPSNPISELSVSPSFFFFLNFLGSYLLPLLYITLMKLSFTVYSYYMSRTQIGQTISIISNYNFTTTIPSPHSQWFTQDRHVTQREIRNFLTDWYINWLDSLGEGLGWIRLSLFEHLDPNKPETSQSLGCTSIVSRVPLMVSEYPSHKPNSSD